MAGALILAVQIYGGIGALVAAWFLFLRLDRIDPMARGAITFRPLLVPGLVLLWPLVVWRTLAAPAPAYTQAYTLGDTHRRIWMALAVVLPLLVLASLALRQNGPTEAPPMRLSAP